MKGELHPWVAVANVGVGWEADLVVARLDAEDVPARARGNDLVGIFGPGFQGASARGFLVEVPVPYEAQAKAILARPAALADDEAVGHDDAVDEADEERTD